VEPDVASVLAKGNERDGWGSTEAYSIGRRRDEAEDLGSVAAKPPAGIAQGRRGDWRHLLVSIADHASLPRIVALPRRRCRRGARTQQALQATCDMGHRHDQDLAIEPNLAMSAASEATSST
jgi:hypothetical protein